MYGVAPYADQPYGVPGTATSGPPSFPYAGILDDFNRADTGPPPSANWTSDVRGSGGTGMAVVSNQMKALSLGAGEASNWWSATTFGDDCEAWLTCATSTPNFELWARGTGFGSASPQAYLLWFNVSLEDVVIQKYGPGAGVGWVTITSVHNPIGVGDSLGIRVLGSTIEAWFKGVTGSWSLILSATDSTFTTGGEIGLIDYTTTDLFDNFGGGTVVSGPTVVYAAKMPPMIRSQAVARAGSY
jgi:hypothetical protein